VPISNTGSFTALASLTDVGPACATKRCRSSLRVALPPSFASYVACPARTWLGTRVYAGDAQLSPAAADSSANRGRRGSPRFGSCQLSATALVRHATKSLAVPWVLQVHPQLLHNRVGFYERPRLTPHDTGLARLLIELEDAGSQTPDRKRSLGGKKKRPELRFTLQSAKYERTQRPLDSRTPFGRRITSISFVARSSPWPSARRIADPQFHWRLTFAAGQARPILEKYPGYLRDYPVAALVREKTLYQLERGFFPRAVAAPHAHETASVLEPAR